MQEIDHKEIAKELSTEDLEQRVFRDFEEYTEEARRVYEAEWLSREDHAKVGSFKYCPFCKDRLLPHTKVCQCGYDFILKNDSPAKKKIRTKKLSGIVLILAGAFWLWHLFDYIQKPLVTGPGFAALIYGVYMFFTGKEPKKRFMAPFDFFMGPTKQEKKTSKIKEDSDN